MNEPATNPVRAVQHSLEIVDQLADGPKQFSEILDSVSIGKGPVHNHLTTLRQEGYVIKIGNQFRLSRKFLQFGGRTRHRHPLYENSKQRVKALAQETGEMASFMIEERGRGVRWIQYRGPNAVKTDIYTGQFTPLHLTALGKAILAGKTADWIDEMIDCYGLPKRTETSITDREALDAELETVRDQGFAIDDGEFLRGLRCVAAPVTYEGSEQVVGSIGVTLPVSQNSLDELEDEIAPQVQAKANLIEIEHSRTLLW